MTSRAPSRSDASDPEESPVFSPDFPPATLAEDSSLSPALATWQDIVSAIKLKFKGEMLPPSPRKCTCRVRDNTVFHQEEKDPVFRLPLFPTLQESFGFLQEDLRNPPKQGATDSLLEAQLLAQEKDLRTAISALSLNMWGSKFLASLIADEASTSLCPFCPR